MDTETIQVDLPVFRCPTCDTPHVIRWTVNLMSGEPEWLYFRDCKHKVRAGSIALDDVEWVPIACARPKQ